MNIKKIAVITGAIVLLAGCTITIPYFDIELNLGGEKAPETTMDYLELFLADADPSADASEYKIFEEISSPNGTGKAVVFGLDAAKSASECCENPIGIFVILDGEVSEEYELLTGDVANLSLETITWEDDNTITYMSAIVNETGGKDGQSMVLELE